MRKYENDQDDGAVLFDGEKARKLISLRQSIDGKAEEICQELHKAIELAKEQFRQLGTQYGPQFEQVLAGTDLQGTPLQNVGFDYSKGMKYGIVFGHKIDQDPISQMLEEIINMVQKQGSPTSSRPGKDDIIMHRTDGFEKWDTRTRQHEDA